MHCVGFNLLGVITTNHCDQSLYRQVKLKFLKFLSCWCSIGDGWFNSCKESFPLGHRGKSCYFSISKHPLNARGSIFHNVWHPLLRGPIPQVHSHPWGTEMALERPKKWIKVLKLTRWALQNDHVRVMTWLIASFYTNTLGICFGITKLSRKTLTGFFF